MSSDSFSLSREGFIQKLLAAIFILFVASLVTLISLYWLYALEPSLKRNAVSSATALAQTHGRFVADALTRNGNDITSVNADLDEILLLKNQESNAPFILGIIIDTEIPLALPRGASNLSYGKVDCDECFVTEIPLFHPQSRELIGVARFYSNDIFYRSMVEDVRIRLFGLTAVVLLLLFIVWGSVSSLVRKIRSSERTLYQLFEAAPFPMLLIDLQNRQIKRANLVAQEQHAITGGMPVAQMDESLRNVIDELTLDITIRNREVAMALDGEGETRWVMLSATALGEVGHHTAIVGLVDITTIRAAQTSLELARRHAEEASQAKSEFLATMSHEIRTPMNGILGMVQLLQRSPLDTTQQDYVDAIARSGESLLHLLNDILDFSRMEAGRLELCNDDFNLDALLDETAALMHPIAQDKGLALSRTIHDDVPRNLHGDVAKLRQVLLNLVGNAVKFTHHGTVKIDVKAAPVQEDGTFAVQFAICDTGIGIPQEIHDRIFERFTQGEQGASRRYGGSGLGLAITKGLVELMGGEIAVASTLGVGSCFTFQVRACSALYMQRADKMRQQMQKPLHKLTILVVEDVAINRRVVKGLLNAEGHQIVEATNGEEAVASAAVERFDAILMDLQMPVLDGYQATRIIRTGNGKSRITPIIALTANILQDEQQRCIEAGMHGFIVKPFTLDKLNDELARVVERQII